ncbi:hypothetical protein JCM8097_000918 [Rhodosporidiobolus ruineniae]
MAQTAHSVDDLVALIAGTAPDEVDKTLIPALKKLDKAAESATSSTGGRGSSSRGGASTSSTSAGAAASGAQGGAGGAAHLLEGMMKDGQDPLDVLDPRERTVGYLYILNTRLNAANPDLNVLLPKVQRFVEQFDPEATAKAGEQISYLANLLANLATSCGQPAAPVNALKTLVQRYPQPGYLTHLHPLFLQVIMATNLYEAAAEVLLEDITDLDKSIYPIRYQDHLLYHYLGGTIMALLGDYIRAADLLEIAVSAPGSHASMIQIDAYKKLVLVQLLAYGKTQPLPKYTTQALLLAVKTLCVAYQEYAGAFASLNRHKIAQVMEKGREVFERDLNYGLVLLCDESLRRRQIQSLTETYITQSLGEIATYVGLDASDAKVVEAVEEEVRGMIATKQIFATLTPPPAGAPHAATTVTFTDDPEPFLSHDTVARVTNAIKAAQALEKSWADEGMRVGESKEFVQKAWSAAGNASAGGGTGFGGSFAGGFDDSFDYGSSAGGVPGGWGGQDVIDLDSD